jgi:hypothetical protein
MGVALGLVATMAASPSFGEPEAKPTLGSFLRGNGLKVKVEHQSLWKGPERYSAQLVHSSGKIVEMKYGPKLGTPGLRYGRGRTRVDAVNDLVSQIRGKHMVIGSYSTAPEERSVPISFKTNTFTRLPRFGSRAAQSE